MTLGPFEPYAHDLAPGDHGVLDASWASFTLSVVRSPDDPMFEEAFGRLHREFDPRGEMERREVIEERLAWDPARLVHGHAFLYEMLVVRCDGEVVAVRDHTAIVTPAVLAGRAGANVIVHLSHVLVEPAMRGRGLASWLRALPVDTARRCIAAAPWSQATQAVGQTHASRVRGSVAAQPESAPGITLVAEMEPDDGETAAVLVRLRSYAKAGFRVVDPSRSPYYQPDFRSAAEIDRSSPQPVPLCLVLRRVGREHETRISGTQLRDIVGALHAIFMVHVRADQMAGVQRLSKGMPSGAEMVELLVPGTAPAASREDLK